MLFGLEGAMNDTYFFVWMFIFGFGVNQVFIFGTRLETGCITLERHSFGFDYWLLSFVFMYLKHDYGTIVPGKETCPKVSGCNISFGIKVHIFRLALDTSLIAVLPSDDAVKFLDIQQYMNP